MQVFCTNKKHKFACSFNASKNVTFPNDLESIKAMSRHLSKYKEEHYYKTLATFALTFVTMQTLSIPGTIFLGFLAGSLFGFVSGVILVSLLSAIGASGAYFLTYVFGRRIVQKLSLEKLRRFELRIKQKRNSLWNYFIFLRITPIFPNWFLNNASSLVSVPFKIFFFGTLIGVIPQSIIVVKAGTSIQDINNIYDVINWKTYMLLFLVGTFVALTANHKEIAVPDSPDENVDQVLSKNCN